MTVSLPLIVILGFIAGAAIKFLGIRVWVAVVIALFGLYLAHTVFALAIDHSTRTGVGVVNGTHT